MTHQFPSQTKPRLLTSSIALALACTVTLSGCGPLVVGAGAGAAGVAVAEDRTVGESVDDQVMGAAIREKLLRQNVALSKAIDISVRQGRVLLTGTVGSEDMRVDAVRLAWQVTNVKEVVNEIHVGTVTERFSLTENDFVIASSIKTNMIASKTIAAINYTIEVKNGVVYLIGTARSKAELDELVKLARQTKGVNKVISHVTVALPGSITSP